MTAEILIGLVMLIVMIGAIFIGIQISFTLLFLALAFGYLALGRVVFDLAYLRRCRCSFSWATSPSRRG